MIDCLVACEPGESAVATKCFPESDTLFEDHFPGWPVVPGVLQIEMIAATGGKALRLAHPDRLSVLATVKSAKFYRPIRPEEECVIRAQITQLHKQRAAAEGIVEVAGQRACKATVLYAFRPTPPGFEDPILEAWRDQDPADRVTP